ncbi:FecCD family ABC transporter permease [Neisseria sp. Ec49-e6-T10]|uniref:FecCD family ABC transporter permease n=1 Tax=Neisseria sp. Ec49-e6-T10 TaxID=3140744 RepID=UPI003EBDCEC9
MKTYLIIAFCLFLALILGVCAGHTWYNPIEVILAFNQEQSLSAQLLIQWRLPRVITASIIGLLLGLSGTIFQGVFRNPLAEPWLLGSSGGAAVGATIALLIPLGISLNVSLPLFAFLGAFGAIIIVLSIARIAGSLDTTTLLLAGVAISAVLSAIRSFLMMALSNESISLQVVLSWLLGGVQTPSWPGLILVTFITICCFALALWLSQGLDLLGLGETMAKAFGLSTTHFTIYALLIGSAIVACAVALGGIVAFVGLAAPHIGRWLCGTSHKKLLPVSATIGAIIVVVADALARSLLPPGEIPLGLITALAGGPFFIILLAKQARK